MLICHCCKSNWETNGKSWLRKDGKRDYRCKCGSKKKPVEAIKDNDFVKEVISSKIKKILVIADLHCGAITGLTPPEYFVNPLDKRRRAIQEESWEWFSNTVKDIGYVDALIINGDSIEGKGSRSGGTELITTDLLKQIKIAERCIDEINTDNVFLTYGTSYHVSNNGDDLEVLLADRFNGTIKDHLWLDVNGCIFDFKHKINNSSVLSSRVTSLIKETQWNDEWSKNKATPKADVFVRSHVHYCNSVTDHQNYLAVTTPALQIADTKYGNRICSGTVDYGMILFEVPRNYKNVNDVKMTVYKTQLEYMKSKSIEI
jgi:hypothetical protein